MNEPGTVGVLLDQPTLHDRLAAAPDWLQAHYRTFRDSLLEPHDEAPFPCYFGIEVEQNGELLYAACDSLTDPAALLQLRDVLVEYLATYRNHAERVPLAVFFRPDDAGSSEADSHERLWHILEFLHVHDPEPWPTDIPTDPDDPHWEFCFGGEPIFPTTRAPFYGDRRSRYSPIGLEITFQPRAVFEGITADTEAGQEARSIIQSRMETYDGVCPHADLGDWGAEGDREWTQYLFREDDEASPDECPLQPTREHPKVPTTLLKPGAWQRLATEAAGPTETTSETGTTGVSDD